MSERLTEEMESEQVAQHIAELEAEAAKLRSQIGAAYLQGEAAAREELEDLAELETENAKLREGISSLHLENGRLRQVETRLESENARLRDLLRLGLSYLDWVAALRAEAGDQVLALIAADRKRIAEALGPLPGDTTGGEG